MHANGAQSAFNGSLIVDKFALYVKFLVAGTAALVLIAGLEYAERFRPYESEFTGLVLFSASGLMLLAAAADLVTIYVALELATLPVVALAAFVRVRAAPIEAGVKYLLLSAVSSAFLLYGFAFLYGASGTMQVVAGDGGAPTIAQSLAAGTPDVPFGGYAVLAGVVLAVAGFGFKLSMVPFQMWTPDVYEGAPTPVGAFLATASKAAAFAVVLRLFYEALGGSSADWSTLFAALAAVTMTIGNLVAIAQSNVKRLLGYSAIAHAGYMLIGVAAVTAHGQDAPDASGVTSVLFYLAGYAAMTLAAFFAVVVLTQRSGDERIEAMAGMGEARPARRARAGRRTARPHRHPPDGRLHGQALPVQRRRELGPRLACGRRCRQLGRLRLLLRRHHPHHVPAPAPFPRHSCGGRNLAAHFPRHSCAGRNLAAHFPRRSCGGRNLAAPFFRHSCAGRNLAAHFPRHSCAGRNLAAHFPRPHRALRETRPRGDARRDPCARPLAGRAARSGAYRRVRIARTGADPGVPALIP